MDPNPNVQGKAVQLLTEKGVQVYVAHEKFISEQQSLNASFYVNQLKKRPFITLKWAESFNKIMGDYKRRIAISHPYTQFFTHTLRAKHQAILVGKNTVLVDKPQLNLKYALGKDPLVIIMDTHAQIYPEDYFPNRHGIIVSEKIQKEEGNWKFMQVQNIYDWDSYVERFYSEYQIGSIFVEGGSKVLQTVLNSKYWDEAYIIVNLEKIQTENPVYSPSKISGSLKYLKTIQGNQLFKLINQNLM